MGEQFTKDLYVSPFALNRTSSNCLEIIEWASQMRELSGLKKSNSLNMSDEKYESATVHTRRKIKQLMADTYGMLNLKEVDAGDPYNNVFGDKKEGIVVISADKYNQLLTSEAHLDELEARGVDNWEGYVGSMFYCNQCDAEYEWHKVEYSCPSCNHDLEY